MPEPSNKIKAVKSVTIPIRKLVKIIPDLKEYITITPEIDNDKLINIIINELKLIKSIPPIRTWDDLVLFIESKALRKYARELITLNGEQFCRLVNNNSEFMGSKNQRKTNIDKYKDIDIPNLPLYYINKIKDVTGATQEIRNKKIARILDDYLANKSLENGI